MWVVVVVMKGVMVTKGVMVVVIIIKGILKKSNTFHRKT